MRKIGVFHDEGKYSDVERDRRSNDQVGLEREFKKEES